MHRSPTLRLRARCPATPLLSTALSDHFPDGDATTQSVPHARVANARGQSAGLAQGVKCPTGHESCDLLAAPGNDDLLPARGPLDQLGQTVFGLEDADGGHVDSVQSSTERPGSCAKARSLVTRTVSILRACEPIRRSASPQRPVRHSKGGTRPRAGRAGVELLCALRGWRDPLAAASAATLDEVAGCLARPGRKLEQAAC